MKQNEMCNKKRNLKLLFDSIKIAEVQSSNEWVSSTYIIKWYGQRESAMFHAIVKQRMNFFYPSIASLKFEETQYVKAQYAERKVSNSTSRSCCYVIAALVSILKRL